GQDPVKGRYKPCRAADALVIKHAYVNDGRIRSDSLIVAQKCTVCKIKIPAVAAGSQRRHVRPVTKFVFLEIRVCNKAPAYPDSFRSFYVNERPMVVAYA